MNKEQKRDLMRIVSAAVILIVGFLLPFEKYKFIPFLCAYFIAGYEVIIGAVKNLFHGEIFDENFLMLVASAGAIALGEYPEAVAVMLFYGIGELFEDIAVDRSKDSISELINLAPEHANVIENGKVIEKSPKDITIGDILLIKTGEKVPTDGELTEGEALLDTSPLTGESVPAELRTGDTVLSGSINKGAAFKMRATAEFENSTVSRIIYLVEEATESKSKSESFITRFAKYYTPCVVFAAVLLAVIMSLVTGDVSKWVSRSLLFLVVSCPCALVISVPLTFFCGIGRASKSGILIKGSNFLELLSKADIAVFDKTGTLTKGKFSVCEICPAGISENELLEICAKAESFIDHPIAESVIEAYGKTINENETAKPEQLPGFGATCIISGKRVLVGNASLMKKNNIAYQKAKSPLTVLYVAVDGEYKGYITVADEIKEETVSSIKKIKSLGIKKAVLLTGDNEKAAEYISEKAGIDEIHASLLPEQKVKKLRELKKDKTVIYSGDGLNDAPVIVEADVGIAMGVAGSDAAIEAADVVIMNDDISKVPEAMEIGRKTMRIVKENIVFSLTVKFAVMLLGALGFANMWLAVFADVGVTVIAVLNSLRGQKK